METSKRLVELTVNGRRRDGMAEPRKTLADFLRDDLDLTGTHVGCEQGSCGACTVLLDGEAIFSCLLFAGQANGRKVTTVEGLAAHGKLHPIQEAFRQCHAIQCGFCTPGLIMSVQSLLGENPDPTAAEIRAALAGNLCRCTGYQNIIDAVKLAAQNMRGEAEHAVHTGGGADGGLGDRVQGDPGRE